jgi:hypothetical protein
MEPVLVFHRLVDSLQSFEAAPFNTIQYVVLRAS